MLSPNVFHEFQPMGGVEARDVVMRDPFLVILNLEITGSIVANWLAIDDP
jgi:hypothetical protein